MRKYLIAFVILLQAAALGWIVFERENVLKNGQVVYLRTMPVDPRDIFRGDYVTLNYDINRIPVALTHADFSAKNSPKEMRVYASLTVDAQGIATVTALHSQQPADGLFLRGYTTDNWNLRGNDAEIAVRFGIEKLFVEQGVGKTIEAQQGARNDWQTPMEVAVVVGKNGIGVIRDYRWSSFATRLEPLNMPDNDQDNVNNHIPRPISPRVRFSIRNVSTTTMALVNPSDDCSYGLLAVNDTPFTMANDVCSSVTARADDVLILAPGETYAREMDMSQPRWHIRKEDGQRGVIVGEMGQFNDGSRYRLIYRSPSNANTVNLSASAVPIWIGTIRSAAFTSRGNVD
jgi:uncharacterized membrane-anchored protein